MNFTLTEDEFNELDSLKSQLAFVSALVTGNPADRIELRPADFAEFLSKLETTATRLVDTLLERQEKARSPRAA